MKTAKPTKKPAIIAKPAAKAPEAAPERKRSVKTAAVKTAAKASAPKTATAKTPPAEPASIISPAPMSRPTREITTEMIAERAYLLWEKQGRPHGSDEANWLLAESQLKEEIQSFPA